MHPRKFLHLGFVFVILFLAMMFVAPANAQSPDWKEGVVEGEVTNLSGDPVVNADAKLYRLNAGSYELYWSQWVGDGEYRFWELPAGEWQVAIHVPSDNSEPEQMFEFELTEASPVQVINFENLDDGTIPPLPTPVPGPIVVPSVGDITVSVNHQLGGGLSGIEVQLSGTTEFGTPYSWNKTTESSGQVFFGSVPGGEYRLELAGYPSEWNGLNDPSDFTVDGIKIDQDHSTHEIVFQLTVPENEIPPQGEVSCSIEVKSGSVGQGEPVKIKVHPSPKSQIHVMKVDWGQELFFYPKDEFGAEYVYSDDGTYTITAWVGFDQSAWLASCETSVNVREIYQPRIEITLVEIEASVQQAFLADHFGSNLPAAQAAIEDMNRKLVEFGNAQSAVIQPMQQTGYQVSSAFDWRVGLDQTTLYSCEYVARQGDPSGDPFVNTQYGYTVWVDSMYCDQNQPPLSDNGTGFVKSDTIENGSSLYAKQYGLIGTNLSGPALPFQYGVQGLQFVSSHGVHENLAGVPIEVPTSEHHLTLNRNAKRFGDKYCAFLGYCFGSDAVRYQAFMPGTTSPFMDRSNPIEGLYGVSYPVPPKVGLFATDRNVHLNLHSSGFYFQYYEGVDQGQVELAWDFHGEDHPWFVQMVDEKWSVIISQAELEMLIEMYPDVVMNGNAVEVPTRSFYDFILANVLLMAKYEPEYATFSNHVVHIPAAWQKLVDQLTQAYGFTQLRASGVNIYTDAYAKRGNAENLNQHVLSAVLGLGNYIFKNLCTAQTDKGLPIANEDILVLKYVPLPDGNGVIVESKLGPNLSWIKGDPYHHEVVVSCPGGSFRMVPEGVYYQTLMFADATDWESERLKVLLTEALQLASGVVAEANLAESLAGLNARTASAEEVVASKAEQEIAEAINPQAVVTATVDPQQYWTGQNERTLLNNGEWGDLTYGFDWERCRKDSCAYKELGIPMHTVKAGQTLTDIATNYGTTAATLVRLNNLTPNEDGRLITEGTVLLIGGPGNFPTVPENVLPGEMPAELITLPALPAV